MRLILCQSFQWSAADASTVGRNVQASKLASQMGFSVIRAPLLRRAGRGTRVHVGGPPDSGRDLLPPGSASGEKDVAQSHDAHTLEMTSVMRSVGSVE